jgi:hypothetical protein
MPRAEKKVSALRMIRSLGYKLLINVHLFVPTVPNYIGTYENLWTA